MTEEEILKRLLYRDGLILIINKPSGIPVHQGSFGGDNLENYFKYLQFGLRNPPALAHRLDSDTSGCLVLGRNRKGLQKMGKLFSSGEVQKTYLALIKGVLPQSEGVIDFALKKISSAKDGWKMIVDDDGQKSITEYKVLKTNNKISLVECYPKTGRTHQIRVHLASLGCPILGDSFYNKLDDSPKVSHLMLHSLAIEFKLYPKKEKINIKAPIPDYMQKIIGDCFD